ncbi:MULTISPECIES: SPFH domain-containing protein [Lactobacillales]|uniref:SPFH/Band 7/PHB domain protein n=1 Tax=Enterococcus aquimarinus TaxID=328396 RepID=A0A1L8QQ18_9ENTE|nr:SPFH domain-containing protein [Enterococcus aquimarinus]MBP7952677.1 SPFH/Band 7/PHB domain protein [Enterococcus sp.]MBP8693193.1 SPFH/Band 7/PHB domain protein [Enterococcus sp.]MBP9521232.1 SPFH/Band 7/PHB domain protein [Enterococcus sp.]MBP9639320.1 SPFH/Band 7/PHB domain protein [Enterococcus sp.]MCC9273535.1 SPFH/Band 7/PHB domain protein [Enterococcus aquimarinus]
MFVARIVIFVLIFALLIWLLTSTAVIVHQGEVKVVESFGKFVRTLEPGLHFLIPIVYTVRQRVSLKQVPLEIPPQSAITRDNVIVQIDEAIKYHVTDVRAFVYDNEDAVTAMIQDAQSNLRGIIGKMDLNEVLNGTEEINVALFESIKDITAGYGLAIDRINIGEILVSDEIINSMNKLITASRDKESMITLSEGRKHSLILDSEAKSSEMQIDAEARSKQTKIDAEARADRTRIDAAAEAEKIRVITEAEQLRIKALNQAIKESELTPEVLQYLGLEAFKEVANSETNTVIIPSNMTDLANVPVMKQLWEKTSSEK